MEAEILATLEEYASAYCAKDLDRLMALFDEGDDISIIGTGADELCAGRAAIRDLFARNFSEATAEQFEWHWTKVTVRGDTAVVATTLTIHLDMDGNKIQVPIRWTVSLCRKSGGWLWLHRHASAAAGGQDEGTAYPTK
jgi:ketosteroid isomerase-like protein